MTASRIVPTDPFPATRPDGAGAVDSPRIPSISLEGACVNDTPVPHRDIIRPNARGLGPGRAEDWPPAGLSRPPPPPLGPGRTG